MKEKHYFLPVAWAYCYCLYAMIRANLSWLTVLSGLNMELKNNLWSQNEKQSMIMNSYKDF